MEPRRYEFLDLLRGLAAIAVLLYHYPYFWCVGITPLANPPVPLKSILWPFYQSGGLAVPLFWTISGFVFAAAYKPTISTMEFAVHRFARLYPLHLVTLLLVAALQYYSWSTLGTWTIQGNNTLANFWPQLFLASNWFKPEGQNSFNGPIWSVSVEILVYFMFLIYLKKLPVNFWTAALCAALAFATGPLTQRPISGCATLFFAGVALHYIPRSIALALTLFSLEVVAAVGLAHVGLEARAWQVIVYAMAPTIVLGFVTLDSLTSVPRGLNWIGESTYAIYLLHMPILIAVKLFYGPIPLWLFIGVVLGASVLTFHYFERPVQNAIRRSFKSRDWY